MSQDHAGMLNQPLDVGRDFLDLDNLYFTAAKLAEFDAASGAGTLVWQRQARKPRMAFNQIVAPFEPVPAWEFPPEYPGDFTLPLQVSFVTPRTLRVRWTAVPGHVAPADAESLMLAGP